MIQKRADSSRLLVVYMGYLCRLTAASVVVRRIPDPPTSALLALELSIKPQTGLRM